MPTSGKLEFNAKFIDEILGLELGLQINILVECSKKFFEKYPDPEIWVLLEFQGLTRISRTE